MMNDEAPALSPGGAARICGRRCWRLPCLPGGSLVGKVHELFVAATVSKAPHTARKRVSSLLSTAAAAAERFHYELIYPLRLFPSTQTQGIRSNKVWLYPTLQPPPPRPTPPAPPLLERGRMPLFSTGGKGKRERQKVGKWRQVCEITPQSGEGSKNL